MGARSISERAASSRPVAPSGNRSCFREVPRNTNLGRGGAMNDELKAIRQDIARCRAEIERCERTLALLYKLFAMVNRMQAPLGCLRKELACFEAAKEAQP